MTGLERMIAVATIASAVIVDTAIAVGLATGIRLPASVETKTLVRSRGAVSSATGGRAISTSACTPARPVRDGVSVATSWPTHGIGN